MPTNDEVGAAVLLAIGDMEKSVTKHFDSKMGVHDEKIDKVGETITELGTNFRLHQERSDHRHHDHERRLDETGTKIEVVSNKVLELENGNKSDVIELFGFKVRVSVLIILGLLIAAIAYFEMPVRYETPTGSTIEMNNPEEKSDDVGNDP